MNKNENLTVEQSLSAGAGKYVVVKMLNGRAVSGTLVQHADGYAIKLGIQLVNLNVDEIARPIRIC